MKEKIEKLLAVNPRARAVVRALVTLRSFDGDPELEPAKVEIQLAVMHIEEAIELLFNDLENK